MIHIAVRRETAFCLHVLQALDRVLGEGPAELGHEQLDAPSPGPP